MPLVRSTSFSSGARLRPKLSFRRSNSFHRTRSFRASPFTSNPIQTSRWWPRSKRPNIPQSQWLDELPSEVCERIAAYVSNGFPTLDLLHLALSSSKQGAAVIRTLNHKLTFNPSSCPVHVMHGFVDLMKDNVVEADIVQVKNRHVSRVLEGRMLRVANIIDSRAQLFAVAAPMLIRELHLRIEASVPKKLVLRALACLPLTKLAITCHHGRPSRCPFLKQDAFARACPDLISFSAKCKCHSTDPAPWRVLPYLPYVTELDVFEDIPKQWFPRVAALDSVKVAGRSAYITAVTLGTCVTQLNLMDGVKPLNRNQLAVLTRCPLTVLRARLSLHAEAALPQFCSETPNLRVLELQWHHCRQNRTRCMYYGVRFVDVRKGALLRAVELLPALTELKLLSVRVSLCELTAILQRLGPQLRVFGTSIADQKEEPFDRLRRVVEATAMYNADLREFCVSESVPVFPFGSFVLVGRYESLRRMMDQGAMLGAAVRRLRARAPMLNCKSLDTITRLLVNERYHLIADNDQLRVDPVTRW